MVDNEKNLPDQQEEQPAESGNESFKDVNTDELTTLFQDMKAQTAEILNELKARHAAPDGENEPQADWEAFFETYRAPYRSRKEND